MAIRSQVFLATVKLGFWHNSMPSPRISCAWLLPALIKSLVGNGLGHNSI